jgi:hypothetical protein
MTSMTNSLDTKVQGKAVYLEFVKPAHGITTQVLIMPEGMSTSHKTVGMTVYRRRLSVSQPRKTWKAATTHHTSVTLLSSSSPVTPDQATDQILSFLFPLFRSLETNEYVLYKDPIVVEVTAEDLEAARLGKTPYKAMARIWKVRKQLGFPKEYIHPRPIIPSSTF